MKTIKSLLFAFVLLFVAQSSFAQTAPTRTQLASAVTSTTQGTIVVSSATGFLASSGTNQYAVFIDREMMRVTGVNGTTITVNRANNNGTRNTQHVAGAAVWFGPVGTGFNYATGTGSGSFIASDPAGTCARTAGTYLPVVNYTNGTVWDCLLSTTATTSTWTAMNYNQETQAKPYKNLAISATTYTATLNDEIIGYNTGVAGTITLPTTSMPAGKTLRVQIQVTGVQSITIAASGSETINGAASITIGGIPSFKGAILYYDGAGKWFNATTYGP